MNDFHQNLSFYVSQNNVGGANRAIMQELGKVVVHHRADFIDLLRDTDVPAYADMADAELVKLYFDNIKDNKQLIIGSSLLVNMHNKVSGFDGSAEINDKGVKQAYKVMTSCFVGPPSPGDKERHQFDWKRDGIVDEPKSGFIWNTIAQGVKGAGGRVLDAQHNRKYGALDALKQQNEAQAQMSQSIIAQRQSQIDAINKAKEAKAKNVKIGLIAIGSVVAVGIIALVIYKLKTKHK